MLVCAVRVAIHSGEQLGFAKREGPANTGFIRAIPGSRFFDSGEQFCGQQVVVKMRIRATMFSVH